MTDDARVVDRGHCQLEVFYKKQRTDPGSEFGILPACNPFGVELALGASRAEGESNLIVQGKMVLRELEPNRAGYAISAAAVGGDPAVNGIASFSLLGDRAVAHANLGATRAGGTWGAALEALIFAPRLYGILETYGQRGEKPTLHFGVRFWLIPDRFQIDATVGEQPGSPARRFNIVGLRLLF